MKLIWHATFCLLLGACSGPVTGDALEMGDGATAPTVTAPEPATDTDSGPPALPVAFSLAFSAPAAAGAEGIECLDVRSPNHDVWVGGWRVTKSAIHHINVWQRTKANGTLYPTVTPCGGGASMGSFLLDSSQPVFEQHFGESRGLLIPANSDLVLDVHYLNAGADDTTSTAKVDFYEAASHGVVVNTLLLLGGGTISVPPGATEVHGFRCDALVLARPMPIVSLVGHAHAHNTLLTASLGSEEIYRSTTWREPPIVYPSGLSIPVGGKPEVDCTIANDTGAAIGWGTNLQTSEMCMLYGLVEWPRQVTCTGVSSP